MTGTITIDDLKACHMREAAHYNGGSKWFGYLHRCVEHPRLSRFDKYTREDKGVKSTWRVDGNDCATLDDALAALAIPAVLTDEERAALIEWRDDFEGSWGRRGVGYAMLSALTNKGMLDGRNGVTESGIRTLATHGGSNGG